MKFEELMQDADEWMQRGRAAISKPAVPPLGRTWPSDSFCTLQTLDRFVHLSPSDEWRQWYLAKRDALTQEIQNRAASVLRQEVQR